MAGDKGGRDVAKNKKQEGREIKEQDIGRRDVGLDREAHD
jgi:hypothetical protein